MCADKVFMTFATGYSARNPPGTLALPRKYKPQRSREPDWRPLFSLPGPNPRPTQSIESSHAPSEHGKERLAKRPKPRHPIPHVFLEMMGGILSEVLTIKGPIILVDILRVLTGGCPFINSSVLNLASSLFWDVSGHFSKEIGL